MNTELKTADEWLIDEGYPLTMSMTRSNMADVLERYAYQYQHPVADAAQTAGNGWVSVEERLPDADNEVLVYSDENTMNVAYITDGNRFYSVHGQRVKPTHWQPLPPQP